MDAVDALREPSLRLLGVVAHAVVGAVGEHGVDGALRAGGIRQRVVGDALRDRFGARAAPAESAR